MSRVTTPVPNRSCAHPPRTNREVSREFWVWVCAHPARLGRLVFLVTWTLGLLVAAVDILGEILTP